VWQREWLQGEVLEQQLSYWKQRLAGIESLKMKTDHPRPITPSFRGEELSFELSPELSRSIQALSRQEGVTLFMTLLAAFKTLLYRYTLQEDIVVGADIANRNRKETENLIGFFVNLLALRTNLSGDPTFRQLLGRVREVTLGAYMHQDLPFDKLVEELQIERSLSHNPLFKVIFVLQNAPMGQLELSGLTLEPMPIKSGQAHFDLVLSMSEDAGRLKGALAYRTDLFERATMEKMLSHLQIVLESVVEDPDQPLSNLRLLTEEETEGLTPNSFTGLSLNRKDFENLVLEISEESR